jgi:hypothetical protein
MGIEGGRPEKGKIGVQPEWFYKGHGLLMKGHGAPLLKPVYALDGGEEAEVTGIYIIDKSGTPVRLGFATANEYSDHEMEKINYLYLAPSKIREVAVGPELIVGMEFDNIKGTVKLSRGNDVYWQAEVLTGEENMSHSLDNLEYHYFKYDQFRQPGDIHVHFFGTPVLSCTDGMELEDGDCMHVQFDGMGRELINPILFEPGVEKPIPVKSVD